MCVGGESRRSDPILNAYLVLDSLAQAYDSGRRAKKSLESQSSAAYAAVFFFFPLLFLSMPIVDLIGFFLHLELSLVQSVNIPGLWSLA